MTRRMTFKALCSKFNVMKRRTLHEHKGLLISILCSVLYTLCPLLFTVPSHAEEQMTIQSDSLDYDGGTFTYTARGNVEIYREQAVVRAEEMSYNEKTSYLIATGDVLYEDPDVRIRAKRAELDFEHRTGILYEAEIFSKKDNYHITGEEIEKTGEREYILRKASFTTCDAPVPAWCFRGSDVDVIVGERLKARNITFNIKGQPVFYSPYISAALAKERKTGFLMPGLGYVESKGVHYEQPFFWAISGNRDASLVLDVYSSRGAGKGLEYRFLETDGSRGNLWVYHLKDDKLDSNFWDIRGYYDRERDARITGYLNLNYMNSGEFYREYDPFVVNKSKGFIDPASYLSVSTGRFLESTGEIAVRFESSRLFLSSRYLVDLSESAESSSVAQRFPETGYFMNPQRIGPLVFSFSAVFSNFWREEGTSGRRLDLYPRFSYSFGSDVVINQSLGLRETAYSLSMPGNFDSSPHRESFDYAVTARTRLVKRYPSFVHVIEPSLSYTFIPSTESHLPLFDSTEFYRRTSRIELSLLNRFMDGRGEFLTLRISQPFDSYRGDRPFLPLKLEAAIQRPFTFRGETSYDVNKGRVENVNSDLVISIPQKAGLTLGERFDRERDTLFFSVGMSYAFSRAVSAEGNFWYDAKSGGLKDFIAKLRYQQQCWGVKMIITRREKDYSFSVLFDLLGLGTIRL